MLGRQQIAGIPTAIHELFKNAHDAYAEHAEIDYFRRNEVFILRDDGYGMTRGEVENRWLTLGTESRYNANKPGSIGDWTGPKNLPKRSIKGEKGIGRLAIAAIAPVTLVLTRAARPEGLHDLVVALVHWGIFEQPAIDISCIDVPITEFPGGTLPEKEDIKKLVDKVRQNIENIKEDLSDEAYTRLLKDLNPVQKISPVKIDSKLREFVKKDREPLSLLDGGYGTHFIVMPTVPELNDDIDAGSDNDVAELKKNLLGFSNTMKGEQPVIETEFRDHNLDEYPHELIGPRNFFLPEEYDKADHHFVGSFDEYGQFTGDLRIYGEHKPFVCNWNEGKGRTTKCGPFSIDFAYIMGNSKESILSAQDHASIMEKLYRIGGLYIYLDGIRVLPYGTSDVDFLNIERRRSLSAADWFFSYRRMFGYISISQNQNTKLKEKAGREGFIKNQAYRDFRAILINFFQRLAYEFFRESSPQGESYYENKEALKAESELLKKQGKKAKNRRDKFKKQLDEFFKKYESGKFEETGENIRNTVKNKLDHAISIDNREDLAAEIRNIEKELSKELWDLKNEISIPKPRGLSLTKKLEKDHAAFQRLSNKIRSETINPLEEELFDMIRKTTSNLISDIERRDSAMEVLESTRDQFVKDLSALRRDAYSATEKMRSTLKTVVKEEFSRFTKDLENHLVEFTRKSADRPEQIDSIRASIEEEIKDIKEREVSLFEAIKRQMVDFQETLKERETLEDRTGALEQKTQRLEEQLEFYSEFAQIGTAVGILQHEFEKSAANLRASMRDLKPWADGTPDLKMVYNRMRESFDHLDGYLKLLDPLGRRLRRTKVKLSGEEIKTYLYRIFQNTLDENEIKLLVSKDFKATKIECMSSAVLGAFVNIVDNAIYWVANGATDEKKIWLGTTPEGFTISNSGPGIEERHRERIFEFGETTKPGGRGMGLSISKEALQKEGFDLELIRSGKNTNPAFLIRTEMDEERVE